MHVGQAAGNRSNPMDGNSTTVCTMGPAVEARGCGSSVQAFGSNCPPSSESAWFSGPWPRPKPGACSIPAAV